MKRTLALPAVVLTAGLVLAACGGDDDTATTSPETGSTPAASEPSMPPGDMTSMPTETSMPSETAMATPSASPTGTPASGPHNAADVMFASMMIGHHAEAIEMSDMLLAKPDADPRVLALAEEIKSAQGPEIEQMRGWLAGWGEAVPPADGSIPMTSMDHEMPGMIIEEDMAKLERSTGTAASKLFLQQMTAHHKGAIEMANTEVADGENLDATKLAEMIVDMQQAEIQDMANLAAEL